MFVKIICVTFYNLYYCCYAKTSSSAVQKRHSKVYGKPIAPSLCSILLGAQDPFNFDADLDPSPESALETNVTNILRIPIQEAKHW